MRFVCRRLRSASVGVSVDECDAALGLRLRPLPSAADRPTDRCGVGDSDAAGGGI